MPSRFLAFLVGAALVMIGFLVVTRTVDSPGSAGPPTPDGPDPASLVRAGVVELRAANTGSFRVRAEDAQQQRTASGVYRIEERAHRTETALRTRNGEARRTAILRQGTFYAELTDAAGDARPESTCWGVGEPQELRRFDGTFDIAETRGLPAALLAAGTAIGESLAPSGGGDLVDVGVEIDGTLDLFYVLNVFAAGEADDLGVEPEQARVTARLRIEGEVLRGFTVTGSDLSDATRRAGTLLGAYPDEAVVEADFFDTGRAVDLGLPPDERSFEVAQDSGLLGLRDCLLERSEGGQTVPVVSDGEVVGGVVGRAS